MRLATTTSVENSRLLAHILPNFERLCACAARVIPVGTGKALALARRGDVDALITHAPAAEKEFINDGHGASRDLVMHNYFVLLGPENDPAGARAQKSIDSAMKAIAAAAAPFVSRGDNSGTHQMEALLWQKAGLSPRPSAWYKSAGVGMGRALVVADELRAYILSDYGTYLFFKGKIDLRVVSKNEPALYNPYSVMTTNPQKHPHVNAALARRFVAWLLAPATQKQIADYRVGGRALFFPALPPQ